MRSSFDPRRGVLYAIPWRLKREPPITFRGDEGEMEEYRVRHRNAKFTNQRVELDGKSFEHCRFENCLIILERGDTDVAGCTFTNCKLMLRGNAYTIGRIIKLFTGKSPLKVLDLEEPLFEKPTEDSEENPGS